MDHSEAEEPCEPALIVDQLFEPIGCGLLLRDVAAVGSTTRTLTVRAREELMRRDVASRQLRAWGSHPHWDVALLQVSNFDWKPRQWKALPPMLDTRVDAICAIIANSIYICGGSRRGQPTMAAERLNLDSGDWECLPPLLSRRRVDGDAAVAVMGGQLYICGGLNFDRTSASTAIDRFDPEHCHWEMLPSMPERRRGAAAAVLGERLYVCGGGSMDGSGLAVLAFEPNNDAWELLPPMLDKHYRPLAVVANGTIYVGQRDCRKAGPHGNDLHIGGGCGGSPFVLAQGERFHAGTRTWTRCLGALLSSPGASVAAVMSSCLYLCEAASDGRSIGERCVRVAGSERSEGGGAARASRPRTLRAHQTI